jgi:uncharacterized protein YoxC
MDKVVVDIWPVIIPTILALLIGYVGFIHKLRIDVAVLKQKVESLQKRVDSHSKKQDELLTLVTDFKEDISDKLNEIMVDIAKISTRLNISDHDKKHGGED